VSAKTVPLTRRPPVLLDGVCVTYPGSRSPALRDVTLHVAPGDLCSLVGSSGAGKTTLLRVLTGELRPSAGTAIVAGLDVGSLPARRLPRLRRRIGVASQDPNLLPGRDAVGNIVYALELLGAHPKVAHRRAVDTLDRLGVAHLAGRTPEQMSGGERARVAIARALATGPQVLIADEPTGALDPDTTRTVIDTLAAAADTGVAVIMATHDVVAVDRLGRRVVRLDGGRVSEDTTGGYAHAGFAPPPAAPTRRSLRGAR